jgi:hypothetical protein
MVTNTGGLAGPTFYTSGSTIEGSAAGVVRASSRRRDGKSPSHDLAALTRERAAQGGEREQILELVVAAVTVVADIVTLALSRSRKTEAVPPVKQKPLPGATQPVRWGAPTTVASPLTVSAPTAVPGKRLEAIRSDVGDISVRTHDGYLVRVAALKGGWSITAPDGKTTRVTGSSQVHESDGGRWSVKDRSSFVFGPHKLTVQLSGKKNGAPVSSAMTIYSGSERVTIGGLDTDRPTLDAVAGDALYHDDAVHDGTTYFRGQTKFGESWSVVSSGNSRVMGAR